METLRDFTYSGLNFRLSAEHDDSHGAPWKEEDGHVDVCEVDNVRNKRAGDVVLAEHDRGRGGYIYNLPEAMAKARAEGWGVSDETREKMRQDLGREPSQREVWARAVAEDAKRMRAWLRDDWEYLTLRVQLLDTDGEPVRDCEDYLSGVDSDSTEFVDDCAQDMAANIIATHNLARLSWFQDGANRVRIREAKQRQALISNP